MEGQILGESHRLAWAAMIVATNRLMHRVDRCLGEAGVVRLDVYDVLLTLEGMPEGRARMSDLAAAVLLTRGGITKLVDRLEREGLVERQPCPNDRRVTFIGLTPKGLAERERAWEVYRRELARRFAPHLSEREAREVATVLGRLLHSPPAPSGNTD